MVLLTHPSLQILNKNKTGLFPISRFLVKTIRYKNCHNSRTSSDIDTKHGPVSKVDKRKTTTSKKIDDDVVSTNYDLIIIFSIDG